MRKKQTVYQQFDLPALEREYSPSSCIDDIMVFIQQYIDLSQQALNFAQNSHSVITNLPYGESTDEVLDLFLPVDTSNFKSKLHVYIHGGYWQELTKNESSFAATNFQKNGYHFAVINYSLAPKASLSEIVDQCRQAIVFLYQQADKYGYDKNEIYLSGSSAGGHLAMMMALTDWSKYLAIGSNIIKGICAVSGIYDLTPIALTYINEPLKLSPLEIKENSPLLLNFSCESLANCQIILAYGDNETIEFKRQTTALKDYLTNQNSSVLCAEITDRNHFNVILDLANPNAWLSQQVFEQME